MYALQYMKSKPIWCGSSNFVICFRVTQWRNWTLKYSCIHACNINDASKHVCISRSHYDSPYILKYNTLTSSMSSHVKDLFKHKHRCQRKRRSITIIGLKATYLQRKTMVWSQYTLVVFVCRLHFTFYNNIRHVTWI